MPASFAAFVRPRRPLATTQHAPLALSAPAAPPPALLPPQPPLLTPPPVVNVLKPTDAHLPRCCSLKACLVGSSIVANLLVLLVAVAAAGVRYGIVGQPDRRRPAGRLR